MKKVKSGHRGPAAKCAGAPKNVEEYLSGVPEPACSTLNKMRAAIRSAVPPEATETISYGIPAFKHKRVLVWLAAFRTTAVCSRLLRSSKHSRANLRVSPHPKAPSNSPRTSHSQLHLLRNW